MGKNEGVLAMCSFHPRTPAVAECTDCHKPISSACLKMVNAKPYCESCVVQREEQRLFLAFLFALLVPGVGQVYNGEWEKGLLIFLTGWLLLPWLCRVANAVTVVTEIRTGRRESQTVPAGYLLLALKVLVGPVACLYLSGLLFLVVGGLVAAVGGLLRW